jgi:hypothetical protein
LESQESEDRRYDAVAYLSVDNAYLPASVLSCLRSHVEQACGLPLAFFKESGNAMAKVETVKEYIDEFILYSEVYPKGLAVLYQHSEDHRDTDQALIDIIRLHTGWDVLYVSSFLSENGDVDYTSSPLDLSDNLLSILS